MLEVCKVLSHGDALLLTLHKGSEAGRDVNIDAEDIVNFLLELSGMGRLAEHTDFARLQTIGKGLIAAGTVRIEDIACLFGAQLTYTNQNLNRIGFNLEPLDIHPHVDMTDEERENSDFYAGNIDGL